MKAATETSGNPDRPPDHLAPLPGSEWSLWKQVVLRGSGFPAKGVLPLASPAFAAAIDASLETGAGDALPIVFATEMTQLRGELRRIARTDKFREALLWQNRRALHTGVDSLLRRPEDATDSSTRKHEQMVVRYWQRYCMKNESIGFFGPVGWGRIDPGLAEAISARPGPELLAKRQVYFESWGIEALAAKIAQEPTVRQWIAPRFHPALFLEGTKLHRPDGEPVELGALPTRIVALCDGVRTARSIAEGLARDPRSGVSDTAQVYECLGVLSEQGLVLWKFEISRDMFPERSLFVLLQRIDDPLLRASTLARLDELVLARDEVARAGGAPERLDESLKNLDETFSRLIGSQPTRSDGQMYAGRTLVFEDCRRAFDLEIGSPILARLASPLTLLLESGRWFSHEMARRSRDISQRVHAEAGGGASRVDLPRLWRSLAEPLTAEVRTVAAEFSERWRKVLPFTGEERQVEYTSADLRPRVASMFEAPCPGWSYARYHSPDLMISASSVEDIRRGDFQLVLGEFHGAVLATAQAALVMQHPDRDLLDAAWIQDEEEPRVLPLRPWEDASARTELVLRSPRDVGIEIFPVAKPGQAVLSAGSLVVEVVDDDLRVRSRDGKFEADLIEVVGLALSWAWARHFRFLPSMPHVPRITVDGMVMQRESWRFPAVEMKFAWETDPLGRFVAARRWRKERGLGRFLFAKTSLERKPFYVDLDSPHLVDLLSKQVRQCSTQKEDGADDVLLTEMLPGHEQMWLVDAEGNSFTSELRIVAVDPRRARTFRQVRP